MFGCVPLLVSAITFFLPKYHSRRNEFKEAEEHQETFRSAVLESKTSTDEAFPTPPESPDLPETFESEVLKSTTSTVEAIANSPESPVASDESENELFVPQNTISTDETSAHNPDIADQTRIPWFWTRRKSRDLYTPVVAGKWWSRTPAQLQPMNEKEIRNIGHIARIMETELGEQKLGTERCQYCQANDEECWLYTSRGLTQITNPGQACARCRITPRTGGCSLSTRGPWTTRNPALPPMPPTCILPDVPIPRFAAGRNVLNGYDARK